MRISTTAPPIYFYPRPPRGGRRYDIATSAAATQFLPTPSARRATPAILAIDKARQTISTHALREEGDQGREWGDSPNKRISTHALREEGDASGAFFGASDSISTHALREEGD